MPGGSPGHHGGGRGGALTPRGPDQQGREAQGPGTRCAGARTHCRSRRDEPSDGAIQPHNGERARQPPPWPRPSEPGAGPMAGARGGLVLTNDLPPEREAPRRTETTEPKGQTPASHSGEGRLGERVLLGVRVRAPWTGCCKKASCAATALGPETWCRVYGPRAAGPDAAPGGCWIPEVSRGFRKQRWLSPAVCCSQGRWAHLTSGGGWWLQVRLPASNQRTEGTVAWPGPARGWLSTVSAGQTSRRRSRGDAPPRQGRRSARSRGVRTEGGAPRKPARPGAAGGGGPQGEAGQRAACLNPSPPGARGAREASPLHPRRE